MFRKSEETTDRPRCFWAPVESICFLEKTEDPCWGKTCITLPGSVQTPPPIRTPRSETLLSDGAPQTNAPCHSAEAAFELPRLAR
eukprot:6099540-Pyramimonas_sp.AAC.1